MSQILFNSSVLRWVRQSNEDAKLPLELKFTKIIVGEGRIVWDAGLSGTGDIKYLILS